MRVSNNELTVRRNESFTIDKIIRNRDDSPYIISSEMSNPYFVITVASSLYLRDDTYVYHAWLPVAVPRFYSTVPVCINDFKDQNGDPAYPNGFDDLDGPPAAIVNGRAVLYGDGSDGPCYDALFYFIDNEGNKTYRWWSGSEDKWQPYECRIIYKFLQEHTRDWVEKNYYYNIELLDGELRENCQSNEPPLKSIKDVLPILEPTRLSVLSNLKGDMRWLQ